MLSAAATSPVTLGIIAAYVLGKPLGILGATWLATRPMLGGARLTVTWPVLIGAAASAGIGFTVSLLVATLAFEGALLEEAKLGVLATAVLSPAVAWVAFRVVRLLPDDAARAPARRDRRDDRRPRRRRRPRARPRPRPARRPGDAARVRRLRVPVLRTRGAGHRRSCSTTSATSCATSSVTCRSPTCTRTRSWRPRRRRPRAPRAPSGRCTTGCSATRTRSSPGDLFRHASALDLDLDRFSEDLRRRRHAAHVAEDVRSADASGVSGTPTFFINGRRHHGVYDVDTLARAVKAAAGTARAK